MQTNMWYNNYNQCIEKLTWTFNAPCEIRKDVSEALIDGEKALHTFKTVRDLAIITNYRLIVRRIRDL